MNKKLFNDLRLADLIELYNNRNKDKHIYPMIDFNEYICKKKYSPLHLIETLEDNRNTFRANDKYFFTDNKGRFFSFSKIEDFTTLLREEREERKSTISLQEKIYNYLQTLTLSDLICLYNKTPNRNMTIYMMSDFNDVIAEEGLSPLELAILLESNYFDLEDRYFYFKDDGSISSFMDEDIDSLPFDVKELANYIAKEKAPLNNYLKQLLNENEER